MKSEEKCTGREAKGLEVRFEKYTNGEGVVVKEPHTVLFPIPSTAIISNPNLNQNPGYN